MKKEKLVGIDFFQSEDAIEGADNFYESMKRDWPAPRYKTIITKDKEARKKGLEKLGIIL